MTELSPADIAAQMAEIVGEKYVLTAPAGHGRLI